MKTTTLKIPVIVLFFLVTVTTNAQPGITVFNDFGCNNVSCGCYFKTAALAGYMTEKNSIEAGIQADIIENARFSGFTLNASQVYWINNLPVEIRGFYTLTSPSQILIETDWGIKAMVSRSHFEIFIGADFRSFRLRKQYLEDHDVSGKSLTFHEIYNIIYSFSYQLRPRGSNWNIGLALTNADHFMIYQETNPEIYLSGLYNINRRVSLFAQAWYKSAGVTNLVPNNYGFIFRTGITWKIN
jgi:hypothetical protein